MGWLFLVLWALGLAILGRRMYQRDHKQAWQAIYANGGRSPVMSERDARHMVETVRDVMYAEHLPTAKRVYHWGEGLP